MALNPLFNIARAEATPPGSLAARAAPAAAPTAVGVITAQQSAITFAGAPAAVTVVWKVLGLAIPAVATSKGLPHRAIPRGRDADLLAERNVH